MAELKEDKLVVNNDNIVKKGAKDGWALIKIVWLFLKEELPQFLSNWRTVPRIMMALYGLVFYNTMQCFMSLPEPNNAQAGFVSVWLVRVRPGLVFTSTVKKQTSKSNNNY